MLIQVSRSAIQLRFRKGSLELKVNKEQLLEEIRRESKSKKSHKSLRSRSISHDSSSNKEDTAPLLVTYSELHFSDDLLDVISEDSLENIHEESGQVEREPPNFHLGPSPSSPYDRLEEQDSPVKTTTVEDAVGQQESFV